jgi:hypothetical protein
MFIARTFKSIINLIFVIATLASMGTLAELTYDMANNAADESKRGFLSISELNKQLLSGSQTP